MTCGGNHPSVAGSAVIVINAGSSLVEIGVRRNAGSSLVGIEVRQVARLWPVGVMWIINLAICWVRGAILRLELIISKSGSDLGVPRI